MDSFDAVVQDILNARSAAIEKMLKANGVTEDSNPDDFQLRSHYEADGTEVVELCKVIPVQSITFSYAVSGDKTKVHVANVIDLDTERAKRDKPKDSQE